MKNKCGNIKLTRLKFKEPWLWIYCRLLWSADCVIGHRSIEMCFINKLALPIVDSVMQWFLNPKGSHLSSMIVLDSEILWKLDLMSLSFIQSSIHSDQLFVAHRKTRKHRSLSAIQSSHCVLFEQVESLPLLGSILFFTASSLSCRDVCAFHQPHTL